MNITTLEKLTAAARFDKIHREKVLLEESNRKFIAIRRAKQFKFQEAEQFVLDTIYNHSF